MAAKACNRSWLAHTQLLDSALPVGAFSHSFGLEALVQQGQVQTPEQLRGYLQTMIFGAWASCDAMAVKGVYGFATNQQWDELWLLDTILHANRAARETREGIQKTGKRLLNLAQVMYPDLLWLPLTAAIEQKQCIGCYPTVYGWVSYYLEVPLPQAVEGYLYSCLTAGVNNAVRLMSIGQTQAQSLIASLLPALHEAWREVEDRDPFDFASSVPAMEIAQMQHETLYSRLFMS